MNKFYLRLLFLALLCCGITSNVFSQVLIGNEVFDDANMNGIYDAGEMGLNGVVVNLFDATDLTAPIGTTVTATNGFYTFNAPALSGYVVQFVGPSGYNASAQGAGASAGLDNDSDGDPVTGFTDVFTVADGSADFSVDAGFSMDEAQEVLIGNQVFNDANMNGTLDAGETGISGVVVNLFNPNNLTSPIATTTTGSGGFYLFNAPALSGYVVQFVGPNGFVSSAQGSGAASGVNGDSDADPATGYTDVFTVSPGGVDFSVDAGYFEPDIAPMDVSIGNLVFEDLNCNGVYDFGEPGLDGVMVLLFDPFDLSTPIGSTTTAGGGMYLFNTPALSGYVIQFVGPAGYTSSAQGAGAAAGVDNDSDADPLTGYTNVFTVDPGSSDNTVDAGFCADDMVVPMFDTAASDPCDCENPLNYTAGGVYYVNEVVAISAPAGEVWYTDIPNSSGLYDNAGNPLTIGTAIFTETSPGLYTLEFWHEENVGYAGAFTNGMTTLTTANTCTNCSDTGGMNNPPTALNDTTIYCVLPAEPLEICLPLSDPDGDNVTIVNVDHVFECSIELTSDNCFEFIALPGFMGEAVNTVIYCDDGDPQLCDSVQVTIVVGCPMPVAEDDFVLCAENGLWLNGSYVGSDFANPLDVLANDSDPCGNALTVTNIAAQPSLGTVAIVGGLPVYTPDVGVDQGIDQFTYTVCNACGECTTATVFVEIDKTECVAPDEIFECTMPFTPIEICIDFCLDPPGMIVSTESLFDCAIVNLGNNCIQYTPLPGLMAGTVDQVEVIACNSVGDCDTVLVYIALEEDCEGELPVAVDDSGMTDVDTPLNLCIGDNDIDPQGDGAVTTVDATTAQGGTVQIMTGDCVLYTPPAGFCGVDMFDYEFCNSIGCDVATVTVTVECPPDLMAVDDSDTTDLNTAIVVEVLLNDLGDNLVIDSVCTPMNGSAVIFSDEIVYAPNSGFVGTDCFCYFICDELTNNCDEAEICITVLPEENQAPVYSPDSLCLMLFTDTSLVTCPTVIDPEGDDLTYSIVMNGTLGIASIDSLGCVTYTSGSTEGTDEVVVVACDPQGLCDTLTIKYIIVPQGSLIPPVAEDDAATTDCNSVIIDILANDSDFDSDPSDWAISIVQDPPNGSVLIDSVGNVVYTPNAGFVGLDAFVYQICDPDLQCDTAVVTVDVNCPATAAPECNDDMTVTDAGNAAVIDILANDVFAGDASVNILTLPSNGAVVVNSDGTVTYTPDAGFSGEDEFTYELCDASGLCCTSTVSVLVNALADCELNIPSGFSPNNDGVNDLFVVEDFDCDCNQKDYYVFNRWGNQIYYSRDPGATNDWWNGEYEGDPVPDGTYYYCIICDDSDDVYGGFIEVAR